MPNLKPLLSVLVLLFSLIHVQAQNTKLHVEGSFATAITTTTSNLTLDDSHQVILANAAEGVGITITLPSAVGIEGRKYTIKKIGEGTVSVTTQSNQKIEGLNQSLLFLSEKPFVTLVSDGSDWWEIGKG